jgi:hypothetical protein
MIAMLDPRRRRPFPSAARLFASEVSMRSTRGSTVVSALFLTTLPFLLI